MGFLDKAKQMGEQAKTAAAQAADRANEAETVLWEDLKRNPDHVWNLSLLSKAVTAQNKTADAAMIDARLARALKGADAMVTTSRRE